MKLLLRFKLFVARTEESVSMFLRDGREKGFAEERFLVAE
jgi:hypothetical protein